MLSAEERRRADSFRAEVHQQNYIAAHGALRFVLGMYLGVLPASIEIHPSDGTKPALAAAPISTAAGLSGEERLDSGFDLRFNLSHTHGAVLIGVAIGRELGVDIEWQRPMEDLEGIALSVMSDEELGLWKALKPEDRARAFYQVWTRKESYLKAIGLGLYRSLQDVTVPVSADSDGPIDSRLIQDRAGQGVWVVTDIPAGEGYSASICWEGVDVPQLAVRDLDIAQCDLTGVGKLD
jgi:4'-phosphopantetheinyl transferase